MLVQIDLVAFVTLFILMSHMVYFKAEVLKISHLIIYPIAYFYKTMILSIVFHVKAQCFLMILFCLGFYTHIDSRIQDICTLLHIFLSVYTMAFNFTSIRIKDQ